MNNRGFTQSGYYWEYEISDCSYRGVLWSMAISGLPLTLHTSAHEQMIIEINDFILYEVQDSCCRVFQHELALLSADSCRGLCQRTICSALEPRQLPFLLWHHLPGYLGIPSAPLFGAAKITTHFPSTPKQRNSWVISPFRFREALCGTCRGLTLKIPFSSHLRILYYSWFFKIWGELSLVCKSRNAEFRKCNYNNTWMMMFVLKIITIKK